MTKKLFYITIGIVILLGTSSVTGVIVNKNNEKISSNEFNDSKIVDTFSPPYADDHDDNDGIFAWINANYYSGGMSGFSMAQADTPFSDAEGDILCEFDTWEDDNSRKRSYQISKIKFYFPNFMARMGGNILWTSGGGSIKFKYELIKRTSWGDEEIIDDGTIWSKHLDATPNGFYLETSPQTCTVYSNADYNWYEDDVTIVIRIIGFIYSSASEGYCHCEFEVKIGKIEIYGKQADLTVTDFWTEPSTVIPGELTEIYARITNIGNYKAVIGGGSTSVSFYMDGEYVGKGICNDKFLYLNEVKSVENFEKIDF